MTDITNLSGQELASAQCFTKPGQITVAVGFEGRGH